MNIRDQTLRPQYDVLLSYRRAESSAEARTLKSHLDELNVSSWFDILNLPQDVTIPEQNLKRSLESAVRSSRLLVQFRYNQPIDTTSGKTSLSFSWPFFERQFAKELVTVMMRSPGPSLLHSFSGDVHPFYDLAHLAYLLALAVGKSESLDVYWQRHLAPIESQLADAGPTNGVIAWHALPQRPEIIDPQRPESRRNCLPGEETPEIHPEVVQGHGLHVRDGAHCWRCGRSFGTLARIIIWLANGRSTCHQCREPIAYYNRRPIEVVFAVCILCGLTAGSWITATALLPPIAPIFRASATILFAIAASCAVWDLYLRKWRKLVRWSRYE